jgi:hypothetical protein
MKQARFLLPIFITLCLLVLLHQLLGLGVRTEYKSQASKFTATSWDKTNLDNYFHLSLVRVAVPSEKWLFNKRLYDVREPEFRLFFLSYWQKEIADFPTAGLLLEDLSACPPAGTASSCPVWWEMGLKDFTAQIRQYFSEQTIIFAAITPIKKNQALNRYYLKQLNGVVMKKEDQALWQQYVQDKTDTAIYKNKIIIVY